MLVAHRPVPAPPRSFEDIQRVTSCSASKYPLVPPCEASPVPS